MGVGVILGMYFYIYAVHGPVLFIPFAISVSIGFSSSLFSSTSLSRGLEINPQSCSSLLSSCVCFLFSLLRLRGPTTFSCNQIDLARQILGTIVMAAPPMEWKETHSKCVRER
jgi:hypothetical protein